MSNARIIIESALRDHAATFKIFDVPPGSMSIMVDAAIGRIKSMGPDATATLSVGSAAVTDAVRVGFSAVYGGMSEAQKQAELERREVATATPGATVVAATGTLFAKQVALAMQDEGRIDRDERPSSGAYKAKLTSDGSAISFAKQIGVDPIYAGFFSGASAEMRHAIRDAIQKGTRITDDHVKSPNDVTAVIGAIRAGKMKVDDPRIPPSVRSIMDDMKKSGVDPATADPKAVKKYLKDHPEALDAAKKANKKSLDSVAPKTNDQLKASLNTAPVKSKAQTDPAAKIQSAKL